MAKFCQNCGAALNEGAKFCEYCGSAVQTAAPQNPAPAAPSTGRPVQTVSETPPRAQQANGNAGDRSGVPAPGFSNRVNDPEILAAVQSGRKASKGCAAAIVPLPLIGFVIYSIVSNEMETGDALKYGAFVSLVFLVFAIYSFIKNRASNSYEAVVTDKKEHTTYRGSRHDDDERDMVTEYITYVRTTDGKKKRIVEYDCSSFSAYNYLQVGDRFRYHPQFSFPYELYDKSKAPFIACVKCGAHNPVEADRCGKCGLPLLK